ncbi:MAG: hypothetical protein L3J34_11585 [Flavobacteriaceae bacterium]|nr:hypothetical protein [Flavobacteriaceae bacterium]
MKKIFFAIFSLILMFSCSEDDTNIHYELLPIEEAIVPESFEYGKIYDITVKYIRPDDCYINSDILYEYDFDARNVAVIATYVEENGCEILDAEEELTIRVQALQHSPYIFKFWQGDDDNGHPIYLIIEVPVITNNNKSVSEPKNTHTKM